MRIALVYILMGGGLFFFLVGTIGLIRFPDVMTRIHSAAKCDTLGVLLCITALVLYSGGGLVAVKLILVIAFMWITNPTATHLIAKAEYSQLEHDKSYEMINVYEVKENGDI